MPYWSVFCLDCGGYIADALLECLPMSVRRTAAYRLLFMARLGAALACPYWSGLLGFDEQGQPRIPETGWPVFR